MKKHYLFLLLAFGVAQAQVINFPDANFKAKLLQPPSSLYTGTAYNTDGYTMVVDTNNNGEIEVSEASAVWRLEIIGLNISNLEGIQYFSNLHWLDCYTSSTAPGPLPSSLTGLSIAGNFTVFDPSSVPNLEVLSCVGLTALGPFPASLRILNCDGNNLSVLDLSGLTHLESVECRNNQLTSLNLSGIGPSLYELRCGGNQLASLDLTGATGLVTLDCSSNNLTSLTFPAQDVIKDINCSNNSLISIDLSLHPGLLNLNCAGNHLTSLVFSPQASLDTMACSYNSLTQLTVPEASVVHCQNNALTALSIGTSKLTQLRCNNNLLSDISSWPTYPLLNYLFIANNLISDIDFSKFPQLESLICGYNSFTTLSFDNASPTLSALSCKGNTQLQYLSFHGTYPLLNWADPISFAIDGNSSLAYICASPQYVTPLQQVANALTQPAEVNSYCITDPGATNVIEGQFKLGCLSNSPGLPFQKLDVSDGQNTTILYSNRAGNYYLGNVGSGTFSISPLTQSPYLVFQNPSSASVTFPDTASPFVQNFCATAISSVKDAEISIIPMGVAHPGFSTKYNVVVRNRGTATLSGALQLTFDDNVMNLSQSLPPAGTATPGILTWNANNIAPFSQKVYTATFTMSTPTASPPLNTGDVLSFSATVTVPNEQTPANNTTTIEQTVVNAWDPNDKTCLEGETIGPEMAGQYLHYLIRFENTGTYRAQNVIVEDVIDTSKFDIDTLEPLDGSHAFVTRINGNQVEFVFDNILLPFDDANNDGWVLFRIKTKPTLVLGDSVSNTAGIYFNYNPPVITNTATTTFATMGIDSHFDTAFSLWPNPANDIVNIQSKRGEAITSVSVYNTLGQELLREKGTDLRSVNVSGLATGTYVINIATDQSKSSTQLIKR